MEKTKIEKLAFMKYCNSERNRFVKFINNEVVFDKKLRVKSENLIIAFDQLYDRFSKT